MPTLEYAIAQQVKFAKKKLYKASFDCAAWLVHCCAVSFLYCEGWDGNDCSTPRKRPCTNRWRQSASNEEPTSSTSLSDKGTTYSRCAGVCDIDTGICHCNGTMGRIPPPPGSSPGTPPLQEGRPMLEARCAPNIDDYGQKTYGTVEPLKLYGPDGWCEAPPSAEKRFRCDCILDGLAGRDCEFRTEQFCINQCSGHGECQRGWCKCHEGYYGHDCALLQKGTPNLPGLGSKRPALADLIVDHHNRLSIERKVSLRPLIYIYDLPPIYNSRLLQYRPERRFCTHRFFADDNATRPGEFLYAIESGLHEMFAQSDHRTFNPEEADFFYVPVYTSCYAHPIFGWADYPWFYGIGGQRTAQMSNMLLAAKRWVEATHPFWNRTGGRDHIWLASHDEASCWVPEELRSSVILTHWGRTDLDHTSGTAYPSDNYSRDWIVPEMSSKPWNHILGNNIPCHDPSKDLVIPTLLTPQYLASPLLGNAAQPRTTLLFFRGDFRKISEVGYSRGIRQKLRRLSMENDWLQRYNIKIGGSDEIPGDYSKLLAQSIFCLVVPGDGYSSRAEDSILNGCIPVVIMDEVQAVFESILDWSTFSLRVPEKELDQIPTILSNISADKVISMQFHLSRVWHRFAYFHTPVVQKVIQPIIKRNRHLHSKGPSSLPGPQYSNLKTDDAFATILAWLNSKLPHNMTKSDF